jgi:hypothetical protein
MRCGGPVPSNAAVMRCLTRVVALPDPKNSDFPAELIISYGWVAAYVERYGADKSVTGLGSKSAFTGLEFT